MASALVLDCLIFTLGTFFIPLKTFLGSVFFFVFSFFFFNRTQHGFSFPQMGKSSIVCMSLLNIFFSVVSI